MLVTAKFMNMLSAAYCKVHEYVKCCLLQSSWIC